MSPRLESILALLANKRHGMRSEDMREQLGLTPKPLTRALLYLQSINAVSFVRVGQVTHWVAAKHIAAVHALAAKSKQDAYSRQLRRTANRNRAKRSGCTAPIREWPDADAWAPPGPRIPSVWHLPQAMGLA